MESNCELYQFNLGCKNHLRVGWDTAFDEVELSNQIQSGFGPGTLVPGSLPP